MTIKKVIFLFLCSIFLTGCMSDNIQMEKVTDSTRIAQIKSLESSIMQYFADNGRYPSFNDFSTGLHKYLYGDFPIDILEGENKNNCDFGIMYGVSQDKKNFRLSTCLIYQENITKFAKNDGGVYENRFEVGFGIDNQEITDYFIKDVIAGLVKDEIDGNSSEKQNLESMNVLEKAFALRNDVEEEIKETTNIIETSFQCGDVIKYQDYEYRTILGPDNRCWTKDNMKHETPLSNKNNTWCLNNNCKSRFGAFYDWYVAMGKEDITYNLDNVNYGSDYLDSEDRQKSVCGLLGNGWSLPSDQDWFVLEYEASKDNLQNQKCDMNREGKEGEGCYGAGWKGNKLGGVVGVLAGKFNGVNVEETMKTGRWWTTKIDDIKGNNAYNAYYRLMLNDNDTVYRSYSSSHVGFSVKCIKNDF